MSVFIGVFLALFETKLSYTVIIIACAFALVFLTFNIIRNLITRR